MSTDVNRLAIITWLAENASGLGRTFGRTALMKYCYFLQVVRGVPLGYRFSLYSYGPFDSDVLSDLDIAEALGGVKSSEVYYPGGYGYKIEVGEGAERIKHLGAAFIKEHEPQLRWIVDHFHGWDASSLELASTLVYSDREAERSGEVLTIRALSKRVRDLKPRFSIAQIEGQARRLQGDDLLQSIR
jgi:hypothetical protein